MTDYGASDTSTTTLGANQFPISEAWTPNAGFSAVEGGVQTTDSGGKKSAPVRVEVKDGSDITQGTSTDANTVNSVMGRLTKIRDLLNATLTVGGTITEANSAAIKTDLDNVNTAIGLVSDAAWSGSGNGDVIAILKKIVAELTAGQATMANSLPVTMASNQTAMPIGSAAGTAYGADQTNTRQQISLYGTQTTAGDTAVGVDSNNRVKIAPAPANAGTIIGQVKIVDSGGTNQAGVASSIGANANGGAQLTAGAFQEVAGQGTGVVNGINTDLIPSTDVSAYKWASLQLTGTWSLTLQAQLCNDNSNFNQIQVISAQTQITNAGMLNTLTGNGLYVFPITSRYLRVRATAFTSNTSLVGTLELYTSTPPFVVAAMGTTLSVAPQTSGGPTTFHLIGAATTNATNVKSSQGQVYGYDFSNNSANWAYVKFYNKATAPTPGTDTPVRTVGVPPGGKATYHTTVGIPFSTGIGISTSGGATATTSIQDLDATAVAVNTVSIDIEYK